MGSSTKPRSTTYKPTNASHTKKKPYISKYLYHKYYRLLFHGYKGNIEIAHPFSKFFQDQPTVKVLCSDGTVMTLSDIMKDCNPIYQHEKNSSKVVFIEKLIRLQSESVKSTRIYFCDACHSYGMAFEGNKSFDSLKKKHDFDKGYNGTYCEGFKFAYSAGYIFQHPGRNKKANYLISEADISYKDPTSANTINGSLLEVAKENGGKRRRSEDPEPQVKSETKKQSMQTLPTPPSSQPKQPRHTSHVPIEIRSLQQSAEHILRGVTSDLPRLRPKGAERLQRKGENVSVDNRTRRDGQSKSLQNPSRTTREATATPTPQNTHSLFKILPSATIIAYELFQFDQSLSILNPLVLHLHDLVKEEVFGVRVGSVPELLRFFNVSNVGSLIRSREDGSLEKILRAYLEESNNNIRGPNTGEFVLKRVEESEYFFVNDEDEGVVDETWQLVGYVIPGLEF
ncbi:hypothetical protein WICPIJ_002039 [Wickerhamomyces pijperi]|uniref:Uncharacterized protein n=1 Tax=Wickerhamomyces pijperi TaxID=599730 RepID=A0A9P8QCH9_WICPI|nr:hypothetical protein WICPIJ_002039 [Wickerhamomyces pijperi]